MEIKNFFFIGSRCYYNNNYNQSVVIIDKAEEEGKKYIWLRFYPYYQYGTTNIKSYNTQMIKNIETNKVVSIPIQRLKKPCVFSFYGSMKTCLLELYYEYHKIKNALLRCDGDKMAFYYDPTFEQKLRENVVG